MYVYVWHRIRRPDDNNQSMRTEYIHQHAPCMHACMHNRFRTRDKRSTPYSVECMLGEATDDDNDMRTICIWSTYGVDGCIHNSILQSTKCILLFSFSFPFLPCRDGSLSGWATRNTCVRSTMHKVVMT